VEKYTNVFDPTKLDRDDTPVSVLRLDILNIELEKLLNTGARLVLIDEKLGFMKVDREEIPGPEKMVGYTDDM
jgi:hypothetical protein